MKMILVLKVSTSLNQTNNYILIDYNSMGLMILLLEIHYKRIVQGLGLEAVKKKKELYTYRCTSFTCPFLKRNMPNKL